MNAVDHAPESALELALAEVMRSVPECVAAGVVDMNTGMVLGIRTIDTHPKEVLEEVGAATTELFLGPSVGAIERMFEGTNGVVVGEHYFREIFITSQQLIHVFVRGKQRDDQVLIVVARVSASLGMVLTSSRAALAAVERVS